MKTNLIENEKNLRKDKRTVIEKERNLFQNKKNLIEMKIFQLKMEGFSWKAKNT